jgi:hypothetical protein
LTGELGANDLASVPTTDAEGDGMGEGMGAVVGGSVGAGAGLGLGSAIASLMVPGVGLIFAAGLGAAALLGVGGAAVGAVVGKASEEKLDAGIARDDVAFYRELLKQGRSLVICDCESDEQEADAVFILQNNGAEDTDAVRKRWMSAA